MKKKQSSKTVTVLVCILVMLILLAIDLITKLWMYAVFDEFEGTGYFWLFRIYLQYNDGAAYGWGGGSEVARITILSLTSVMIVGIAVVFFTVFKHNTHVRVTLAVIEAGALGNLIDRAVLGKVRDFIDLSKIGFGIANVADFYIVIGAVVLVFMLLFIGEDAVLPIRKEWREKAKEKEEAKHKVTDDSQKL